MALHRRDFRREERERRRSIHEPQIVYALDPEIKPVTQNVSGSIQNTTDSPLVIAGYVDEHSTTPTGQVVGAERSRHRGALQRKDRQSPAVQAALSRQEIETMKLGAQPGLTERRNSGPTGALSEAIVAAWDFSDGINTIIGKDHGPYLFDAQIVNCPTRAMTGYNWSRSQFRLEARREGIRRHPFPR